MPRYVDRSLRIGRIVYPMAKRLIPDCYAGIESDDTAANRTDVSRKRVGTFDPSLIEDPTEF